MHHPVISGLSTANPPLYVSSATAYDFYTTHFPLAVEERALYRKLLLGGTVQGRYVGVDAYEQAAETDQDTLIQRYLKFGEKIATQAAGKALAEAGRTADQIDTLVVNTCTGYLCPGLSSYVAESLGLKPSVKAFDLMGMGCGAAVPNLECAAGILGRNGGTAALSIAVEICSATLFMGNDPGLIVSNCIFGDGASAAVLENAPAQGRRRAGVKLLDFEAGLLPKHREALRYRTEGGRLRNVLTSRVPVIGASIIQDIARRLLDRHELKTADVKWWAVHAGGTAVLQQVEKTLKLDQDQLRFSHQIFKNYGNMSSPTVMFVLDLIRRTAPVQDGDSVLLLSFGAGFSGFAALGRFECSEEDAGSSPE